jgi:O-antigen/teichoic acid export membrane protein
MPPAPRPSWLLIFNALAVILACLVSLGYVLWIIATQKNQLLILGGPLMLCVPPLIALMQYRAVFQGSENAARQVGKYLFIGGGLLAILFAMLTCINAANRQQFDVPGLALLSSLTAAFVYLLFCGWTNQRWAEQLRHWEEENSQEEKS